MRVWVCILFSNRLCLRVCVCVWVLLQILQSPRVVVVCECIWVCVFICVCICVYWLYSVFFRLRSDARPRQSHMLVCVCVCDCSLWMCVWHTGNLYILYSKRCSMRCGALLYLESKRYETFRLTVQCRIYVLYIRYNTHIYVRMVAHNNGSGWLADRRSRSTTSMTATGVLCATRNKSASLSSANRASFGVYSACEFVCVFFVHKCTCTTTANNPNDAQNKIQDNCRAHSAKCTQLFREGLPRSRP